MHPIICFEGPSAIGKTTLCSSLAADFSIIPEANLLFTRSPNDDRLQYLRWQTERYQRALAAPTPAILDGDIFQPLWYSWTYSFPAQYNSLAEMKAFYTDAMRRGIIRFPDLYVLFYTSEAELRRRKEGDADRQRRHFGEHLALIGSQQQYFSFLKAHTGLRVTILPYEDATTAKQAVLAEIAGLTQPQQHDEADLQRVLQWLSVTLPLNP
jgi:hypothetical protein